MVTAIKKKKKKEITPFAATWIDFAVTSQVSQKDKDKYHILPDVGSKMTQMNLYTKQKQTHRHGEQTAVTKGRRWGGGMDWSLG